MSNPILRAAGYRRVSMREQVDGFSLAAQETNIRQYVEAQGWELAQLYTDAGISAKKDSNRPALNQLIHDAQAGKFDVVVVDKLDRFYRHLRGLLSALDELNEAGVSFVSVQERLDFTTVWGKLTLTVLGTLAEVYIDNLRQETRKGKLQRARDGLWNGNIPFGYCRGLCSNCLEPNGPGYCPRVGQENLSDGEHLVLHPLEKQVIRQIFEWYASGEESDATIARRLTMLNLDEKGSLPRSRGIPGRIPPGNPIQKDLLRNWLTNPFYTGLIPYYSLNTDGRQHDRHPQFTFPGQHPKIIEPDLYQRVQEVRRLKGKSPVSKIGPNTRIYLLSGLLRCGYCGRPMRGSNSKQTHYYYRDTTNIEKSALCPQHNVRAEDIENLFINWLKQILENENTIEAQRTIQTTLNQAELRYQRAQELYLAGQLSKSALDSEKMRLETLTGGLDIEKFGAIIASQSQMRGELQKWHLSSTLNRRRLVLLAAERVFIRDSVLIGVQPTSALLPFTGKGVCNSGPDGGGALLEVNLGGQDYPGIGLLL